MQTATVRIERKGANAITTVRVSDDLGGWGAPTAAVVECPPCENRDSTSLDGRAHPPTDGAKMQSSYIAMRKTVWLAFTACLSLLAGNPPSLRSQQQDQAAKLYADTSKSVLLLQVKSGAGDVVAQGSGFVVAGGKIVTNEHVVREGRVFVVDLPGAKLVPLTVETIDAFNDLAILTATRALPVKPLALANELPAPGVAIYSVGYTTGTDSSINTGVVLGIRRLIGRQLIAVTVPVYPASSGGPVLNSAGDVVGVAVKGILHHQANPIMTTESDFVASIHKDDRFAIPARLIQKLLRHDTATESDVTALLEKAQRLQGERSEYGVPQEPNIERQKIDRQIDFTLQSALEQAGSAGDALVEVAEEAHAQFKFDIAITAAERALRSSPTAETSLILARALNGKAIRASDADRPSLFERAEKAARAAVRLSKNPSTESYIQLAFALEHRVTYSEAEDNYRHAFDLAKAANDLETQARCLRPLVSITYSLGKVDQSKDWFRALVATGLDNYFDWKEQGSRLLTLQQYSEAGQHYQQAALRFGGWVSWCDAADAFYFTAGGDYDDTILLCARKCISEGSRVDDSKKEVARAHAHMAYILNTRGVYQEALSHAREASTADASDPFAFDFQAVALLGLRRFQEAVNASDQAIRLSDGKFAYMHFHLGSGYFEVENWEFARQSFEKAAQLDPKDTAAPYNVALCLVRLGYYLDAANWFEEVLRRDPNYPQKADLLNRIEKLRQ